MDTKLEDFCLKVTSVEEFHAITNRAIKLFGLKLFQQKQNSHIHHFDMGRCTICSIPQRAM
jgi:hypothetical protein